MTRVGLLEFPYFFMGEQHDGLWRKAPRACVRCDSRECATSSEHGIGLCEYGVNYISTPLGLSLNGFLIHDYKRRMIGNSKLARSRHKKNLKSFDVDNVASAVVAARIQKSFENIENDVFYKKSSLMFSEMEAALSDDIASDVARNFEEKKDKLAASMLHDQMQYISVIKQSIQIVMREKYGVKSPFSSVGEQYRGDPVYEREKSIAVACECFILGQRALSVLGNEDEYELLEGRIHRVFHKAKHLLKSIAVQRGVRIEHGASMDEVYLPEDRDLAQIVAFSILQNAVKYSPDKGIVSIKYLICNGELICTVSSYGPKIDREEYDKIFRFGVRGGHAKVRGVPGDGIGLFHANKAARGWARIEVDQESDAGELGFYMTRFRIYLKLVDLQ